MLTVYNGVDHSAIKLPNIFHWNEIKLDILLKMGMKCSAAPTANRNVQKFLTTEVKQNNNLPILIHAKSL